MKTVRLDSSERLFYKTVYNAAFANPFSSLREKLDLKIAGLFPSVPRRESINQCIREIDRRIRQLEAQGRATIHAYEGEDCKLIRIVFLFDIFHKFRDDFDRLIEDQIEAQDTSIKVPFASEAMQLLHRRGFEPAAILHYLALSYQLRRAFFFISNTLTGESSCMRELKEHLWYNVFTHDMEMYDKYLWNKMEDFSTLLLGETGTGKGTAARAIGMSGFIPFDEKQNCFAQSFTKAFSSLNLSQYPETLLESELFGHKKGAFTGAVDDYQGVFDRCSPYGSILLDEIGEIPEHVQIKLLRILQDRRFTPVGGHTPARFNGRVIAATNRPKQDIMEGNIFRDDFYYRLCSDIIEVPPLARRIQERPAELEDLLAVTIQKMMGEDNHELVKKTADIIDRILGKDYHWPGNVRELEQCVRSIMLRKGYRGKSGRARPGQSPEKQLINGVMSCSISVSSLVSRYCALLYDRFQTYEEVARRTGLDRRTTKKYIQNHIKNQT